LRSLPPDTSDSEKRRILSEAFDRMIVDDQKKLRSAAYRQILELQVKKLQLINGMYAEEDARQAKAVRGALS